MPHLKSPRKLIHRFCTRYVFKEAYHDNIVSETVSRTDKDELRDMVVAAYGKKLFEGKPTYWAIPKVDKGLVLSDSRGEGAFQK